MRDEEKMRHQEKMRDQEKMIEGLYRFGHRRQYFDAIRCESRSTERRSVSP